MFGYHLDSNGFKCTWLHTEYSSSKRLNNYNESSEICENWRVEAELHLETDLNGKFRKLKMNDGCHFENGYISISQP